MSGPTGGSVCLSAAQAPMRWPSVQVTEDGVRLVVGAGIAAGHGYAGRSVIEAAQDGAVREPVRFRKRGLGALRGMARATGLDTARAPA